jgi:hypothetical protein
MSRYSKLIHWETHTTLESSKHYTTEDNYEMFPDGTLIHCQLINSYGKNIKSDGNFGNQLIWCRVCDQKVFRGDILYRVKINVVGKGGTTRASLTNWPRLADEPPGHLSLCDRDDSAKPIDSFPE